MSYSPGPEPSTVGSLEYYVQTFSAEWSTLIGPDPSRHCALIGWDHGVATPALLCHKEPARRIQSPLLGALERKIPQLGCISLAPRWFFMA